MFLFSHSGYPTYGPFVMPEAECTSEKPSGCISCLEAIHQVSIKPDPDATTPSSLHSSDLDTDDSLLSGSEYEWSDHDESYTEGENSGQRIFNDSGKDYCTEERNTYPDPNCIGTEVQNLHVDKLDQDQQATAISPNSVSPNSRSTSQNDYNPAEEIVSSSPNFVTTPSRDLCAVKSDPDQQRTAICPTPPVYSDPDYLKDCNTPQESKSPDSGSSVHNTLDLSIVKSEPADEEGSACETQKDSVSDNHSWQDGMIDEVAIKPDPDMQEDASFPYTSTLDEQSSQEDYASSLAVHNDFANSFSDCDQVQIKTELDGQNQDDVSLSFPSYIQAMKSEEKEGDSSNSEYRPYKGTQKRKNRSVGKKRQRRLARHTRQSNRAREKRSTMTMEEKERCKYLQKIRTNERRKNMTAEEKEQYRYLQRIRTNRRRRNMTAEEKEQYKYEQRIRTNERRRNMCEEERKRYLRLQRERTRERRNQIKSNETPEEREKRLATQREVKRIKRMNMPQEEKERYKIACRERAREKRKEQKLNRMVQMPDNDDAQTKPGTDVQFEWGSTEQNAVAHAVNNVFEGNDAGETKKDNAASNIDTNIIKEFDRCIEQKQKTQLKERKLRHECQECGQKFYKAECYDVHMKKHAGIKPYECEICGQKYARAKNLTLHKRMHEGTLDHQVCDICGQKFSWSYNLKAHQYLHTGEKSFECEHCGKKFARKDTLLVHKRTHDEKSETVAEKRFLCSECGKKFASNSKLKEHIRTHTNEKPFSCTFCDKKFSSGSSLTKHNRLHTGEKPFECDVCGKKFTESGQRTKHMVIHTGLKPFECDVCGKKFSWPAQLNTHKKVCTGESPGLEANTRTHIVETPFECKECGKTFSEGSHLKAHTSQMHSPASGLEPMPEDYSRYQADDNGDRPPVLPLPARSAYRPPDQSNESHQKTHSSEVHSPPGLEMMPEDYIRYQSNANNRDNPPVLPLPARSAYRPPDQRSDESRLQSHSTHIHSPPSLEPLPEDYNSYKSDQHNRDHPLMLPIPGRSASRPPDQCISKSHLKTHAPQMHSQPSLEPLPEDYSRYQSDQHNNGHPSILHQPTISEGRPPDQSSEESHLNASSSHMHSPPSSGMEPIPQNYSRHQTDESNRDLPSVLPRVPLPPWSAYYRPPDQSNPAIYPHYYGLPLPVVMPSTSGVQTPRS